MDDGFISDDLLNLLKTFIIRDSNPQEHMLLLRGDEEPYPLGVLFHPMADLSDILSPLDSLRYGRIQMSMYEGD